MANAAWEPLPTPRQRVGRDAFVVTPFARLARTHALSAAGDGAIAVALAGSLFFSLDYQAARWRVVLYLVLTLAPFSVVAPLIGPAIDRVRGGARWIIIATCASRLAVAALMVRELDSFLLFPLAFTMLVMAKGYAVAKSAYLPTTVRSDRALVGANSRLALLSALSGVAGGAPAAAVAALVGSEAAVIVAVVLFTAATVVGFRIPAPTAPEVGAPTAQEKAELSSAGVRLAATSMGFLRGTVGFLTLWIAFELRARAASSLEFAIVLGPIGAGAIIGAALAPRIRRVLTEEHMLAGALAVTALAGVFSAVMGGLVGAAIVGAGVAVVSASAKQAFDSLVQRDAPNADHGRVFALYEARFQLLWVVGALVGVLLPLPLWLGFILVAAGAAAAGALFLVGRRAIRAGSEPPRLTDLMLRLASEPEDRLAAGGAGQGGGGGSPSAGDGERDDAGRGR